MTTTDTTQTPFDQPNAQSTDPEGGTGAYSFDGKPDRWKRYRLPHPKTGKADGWTRATTFAKSISDTFTLSQWSQRMVAWGLSQRADLLMSVASASIDDRDTLNRLAEQAKEAAGAKIGANLGTAIHAFTEMIDRGEKPVIPAAYQPHVAAWSALLAKYNLEVLDIERVVLCLGYDDPDGSGKRGVAGTLDRVCRFTKDTTIEGPGGISHTFKKGEIIIVDLKTGKTMEYGGLEIAIQLATYANAQQRWDKEKGEWLPQWKRMNTDFALVVHIPATAPGETVEAAMMLVDIRSGHELAQLCTAVRAARKLKNLMVKLSVVEEQPVVGAVVTSDARVLTGSMKAISAPHEAGWDQRVADARTVEEATDVWLAAMAKGANTPELLAKVKARRAAILADTAAG